MLAFWTFGAVPVPIGCAHFEIWNLRFAMRNVCPSEVSTRGRLTSLSSFISWVTWARVGELLSKLRCHVIYERSLSKNLFCLLSLWWWKKELHNSEEAFEIKSETFLTTRLFLHFFRLQIALLIQKCRAHSMWVTRH